MPSFCVSVYRSYFSRTPEAFQLWEIFESSDVLQYWDGRANDGTEVGQEDVYVWLIEIYDSDFEQSHRYVGHVTLIR